MVGCDERGLDLRRGGAGRDEEGAQESRQVELGVDCLKVE